MQHRHERLLRLARLLQTTTRLAQARVSALERADLKLEQQQQDLLGAIDRPGPLQSLFAAAAVRRTASLAQERSVLEREIASGHESLRDAEMRSRVANRAIDGLRATLNDMDQRKSLEALGVDLAQASVSRKAPETRF